MSVKVRDYAKRIIADRDWKSRRNAREVVEESFLKWEDFVHGNIDKRWRASAQKFRNISHYGSGARGTRARKLPQRSRRAKGQEISRRRR